MKRRALQHWSRLQSLIFSQQHSDTEYRSTTATNMATNTDTHNNEQIQNRSDDTETYLDDRGINHCDAKHPPAMENVNAITTIQQEMQSLGLISHPPISDKLGVTAPAGSQFSKFRFLDLPGELRNSIYSMAVDERAISLGSFAVPAIARASRQLRQEFLPVFYAQSNFQLKFAAWGLSHSISLARLYDNQKQCERCELETPREAECDSLCLEPSVRAFVRSTQISARLKNVTFNVAEILESVDGMLMEKIGTSAFYTMRLKVDRMSRAMVTTSYDRLGVQNWDFRSVHADLERAKAIAMEFAAEEGFRGFTISQLQEIAKRFASSTSDGARD